MDTGRRIDFAALDTGTTIRQALDALVEADLSEDRQAAAGQVLARVEELEQRLNMARRTAWAAVPIAWREVMVGDVIVGKDGALLAVVDTETDQGEYWIRYVTGSSSLLISTRDPDKPVPVLRRPTVDALDVLARQLGAQVMK